MKKLTLSDGELLIKAWQSIISSKDGTELDHSNALYQTFLRFLASKGIRIVPKDIVDNERKLLIRGLSIEYVRELREILDPERENAEDDLVLMLMLATAEERRKAIQRLKMKGYCF